MASLIPLLLGVIPQILNTGKEIVGQTGHFINQIAGTKDAADVIGKLGHEINKIAGTRSSGEVVNKVRDEIDKIRGVRTDTLNRQLVDENAVPMKYKMNRDMDPEPKQAYFTNEAVVSRIGNLPRRQVRNLPLRQVRTRPKKVRRTTGRVY